MANFARLDSNNVVVNIITIDNNVLMTNGIEDEQKGIDFCHQLFDKDFPNYTYKQCWISKYRRFNYPRIGAVYDVQNDAFINPKPYSLWVLDSNFQWIPHIPKPNNGNQYEIEITNHETGEGIWRDINYFIQ